MSASTSRLRFFHVCGEDELSAQTHQTTRVSMQALPMKFIRPPGVGSAPIGTVSLSKSAERAKVQSVEIVHLILAGLLRNVARRQEVNGFASLLVDPEEVRSAVQSHLKGLSVAGAFGELCLPKAVGWALVERDSEPRLPAMEIRGSDGRRSFFRFDDQAVSVFKSEFTTVARIASANGLEQKVVVARLKSVGVRPVIRRDEVGRDFYRVVDIPHFELV